MSRSIHPFYLLAVLCVAGGPTAAAAQAPPPSAAPARPRPAAAKPARPAQPAGFAAVAKEAAAAREANDLDKAIALYKRGLALKPDWAEGWWGLGAACYDLDRYDEA